MPPNHFESEVESFLEGSHGDRTHINRADHLTVTPLCGTLLGDPRLRDPAARPHSHQTGELHYTGVRHAGDTPPEGFV